jgi:hypothetical protein
VSRGERNEVGEALERDRARVGDVGAIASCRERNSIIVG